MRSVGIRELRQNASALVDAVEATGESIEVTNHGRPVARLTPIGADHSPSRAQLIETGVLRPGRGDLLEVRPVRLTEGAPSTGALLADDRAER